jgi:hypothetical protein
MVRAHQLPKPQGLKVCMPQKSINNQQAPQPEGRLLAGLIQGICRSIALTVEVFLHGGFGCRYVGCGFMGVVLIYGFSLWFPPQEILPLLWYGAIYGILWLIATANVLIRWWRGRSRMHSLYAGRPLLWRVIPTWKETNVKQVEALAVILLGLGVHCLSRPLGDYLMLAATLVFLRAYGFAAEQRSRAVELNDSVIEQQLVAERFRDVRGEDI